MRRLTRELDFRAAQPGFEVPYGVAWLLTLHSELLRSREDWAQRLAPLASLCSEHFQSWLDRLPCPVRGGEHSQSAFAMSLALLAAREREDAEAAQAIEERARKFYLEDRAAPLAYEPSAFDFLSPSLSQAELLSLVLPSHEFSAWFAAFMPTLSLQPVATVDRSNGKLAHWDGLNLSRSWMLSRIAGALPEEFPTRAALRHSAEVHFQVGAEGLNSEHYAASHWLESFALYAATEGDRVPRDG